MVISVWNVLPPGTSGKLLEATGGGSDANTFFTHGIQTLNLSAGYEDVHTTQEHIRVSELVRSAALVEAIVRS